MFCNVLHLIYILILNLIWWCIVSHVQISRSRQEAVWEGQCSHCCQMKPLEPIEDTRRDSQPNQSGTPSGPQCIVRISMPYHAHLQSTKLFLYNILNILCEINLCQTWPWPSTWCYLSHNAASQVRAYHQEECYEGRVRLARDWFLVSGPKQKSKNVIVCE